MRAVVLAAELSAKFQAELILIDVVEHGEPPGWALAEYVRLDHMRGSMPQLAESFARDAVKKARTEAETRQPTIRRA